MIYTLPHIITSSAKRHPEKVAFSCGTNTRTYIQMADQMNQLANTLMELGIQKGDRVGVYINRNIETAVAIFGIMRVGGIYVPLDTNAPPNLTNFLIEDCDIKVLISHHTQRRKIRTLLEHTSNIETIIGWDDSPKVNTISWDSVLTKQKTLCNEVQLLEDDPAYIIYTSGSTGNPKGIVHSHRSGLSYARLSIDTFGIHSSDVIANHAPVFFDISLFGYFAGPLAGATTVIISDAFIVLPVSLAQLIEKQKISIWYSVPLALVQMLQTGTLQDIDASTLRWVMYAGEAFPPKYLKQLMDIWSDKSFCNKYGPAETNVCTHHNITKTINPDQPIPIGNVWGNTEARIINSEEEDITTGEEGELIIRSATTMLGYWQNEELTRQAFLHRKGRHGFVERYYRTGDLVKRGNSGVIHFLGRIDHQIKTRGYRVELGAIESALINHPNILEAIAYPTTDGDNTVSISAAVTVNHVVDEQDMIEYLKDSLPVYAIPSEIKIVDQFQKTGSGKMNRPAIIADLTNEK